MSDGTSEMTGDADTGIASDLTDALQTGTTAGPALDKRRLVVLCGVLQGLVLVVLGLESAGIGLSVLRPVVAAPYLTFVPGLLLVALLGIDYTVGRVVAYSIGLSMLTLMLVGGVASLTLPMLGIERPLDVEVYAPTLALVTIALLLAVVVFVDEYELPMDARQLARPTPLALALLPLGSVLATFVFEQTDSNVGLLVLLVVIALIPLSLGLRDWLGELKPLAVWAISLALVYHASLGPYTGGHQLSQLTVELGRWYPNYADGMGSLLANGVLFPTYAIFSGVRIGVEWGVINPFLISFLPVFLYLIFKTQTDGVHAFLAACLFMFAFPFYTLYPGGGRVSTPVFFLALVGVALTDQDSPRSKRSPLALAFVPGIAVSHYGTAWVVMFGFIVSIVVLASFYFRDAVVKHGGLPRGPSHEMNPFRTAPEWVRSTFLTPMFVVYYTVFALGWYLYTGLGGKFKTLPNHIADGIEGLLFEGDFSGGAVRSATMDYGSTAVSVSRMLYIVFGALMAFGVAVALLYRLYGRRRVEDEFLALATGFLSMLGASFLPFSSGFNTARVMMIIFVFTAAFAVIGLSELSSYVGSLFPDVNETLSVVGSKSSVSFVALLMAVFLLLNSGVVSATVTNDFAPSNQVLSQQLLQSDDPIERSKANECSECNIRTHAWAFGHVGENRTLYGDDLAEAQVDYYRGRITERLGRVPTGARYQSPWFARNGTDGPAFMVLLPHNVDTGGVFHESKYDWRAYGPLEDRFAAAHKIYAGHDSAVYLVPDEE